MEGTVSIVVKSNPEQVFDYIANLENAPEWVPDLVSMRQTTSGEVGVGTRYSETVKMGKRESEAELEVTEYDRPNLFAHNGEGGPVRFTARFTVTPDGNGTKIVHDYSVKMTGLFKILAPLTNGWVRKNTNAAMDNLKEILDKQ